MNRKQIKELVNTIIFNAIDQRIPQIELTGEKDLIGDLRVESFELINIFYSLEADFHIVLNRNKLTEIKKIQHIYDYINNELGNDEESYF